MHIILPHWIFVNGSTGNLFTFSALSKFFAFISSIFIDFLINLWYNGSEYYLQEAMSLRIDVLGISFDNLTLDEATQQGQRLVLEDSFSYGVTPNPEFILTARENPAFRTTLNEASLVLADGIGVSYCAKILGRPLKAKVPGIDFATNLLGWMATHEKRLFLLGAKPGIAEQAAENLMKNYPGLIVCGTHDGYFKEDAPVVQAIKEAKADVLFVCLGAPRQELWMAEHGASTGVSLAMGLGGVLDVFSGTVERAPVFFQKLGLEWFHRLITQPWRWKRMIKLPLVLFYAMGERLKGGR